MGSKDGTTAPLSGREDWNGKLASSQSLRPHEHYEDLPLYGYSECRTFPPRAIGRNCNAPTVSSSPSAVLRSQKETKWKVQISQKKPRTRYAGWTSTPQSPSIGILIRAANISFAARVALINFARL